MRQPRVTVLMPVYNHARYVGQALESILAQSFGDFELVVLDDGSVDDTLDVVGGYTDPRIRIVRNETNLGIPRTRNRAVDEARGEYIAWMDSDDIACPERLEWQTAYLDANPACALVGSYAQWIDEDGAPLRVRKRPTDPMEIRAQLLFIGCFTNTTVTSRRSVQAGYRYREDFPLGSDVELWDRIAMAHPVANIPKVTVYHRTHTGRTGGPKNERSSVTRSSKRLLLERQLGALGVEYTSEDLARHMQLRTKGSIPRDPEFVRWASGWLRQLLAANRERGIYPEPAFARAVSERWVKVCARAARFRALRLILTSDLSRPVLAGLPRRLAIRAVGWAPSVGV